MKNLIFGIIIVIIIILLALWQPFSGPINGVAIGGLAAVAATLFVSADTPGQLKSLVVDDCDKSTDTNVRGSGIIHIKTILRDAFRNAQKALVASTSLGAVLASSGLGGDEIVKILSLTVDASMYIGDLALMFVQDASEYGPVLASIWKITFADGVDGVRIAMTDIYSKMGAGVARAVAYIRGIYVSAIEWLAGMFGKAVSALIPDDMSLVGWGLSETIIAGSRILSGNLFWVLNAAYNHAVPDIVHGILQRPERMRDSIIATLELIRKYLISDDKTSWAKWAAQHVARQGAVNATALAVLLPGLFILPILMIPLAGIIAASGTLVNAFASSRIGARQISNILGALYTTKFTVPVIGVVTAVDALVIYMQKIIPLMFAGAFIMSDYDALIGTAIKKDAVGEGAPRLITDDLAPVIAIDGVDKSATIDKMMASHVYKTPDVFESTLESVPS